MWCFRGTSLSTGSCRIEGNKNWDCEREEKESKKGQFESADIKLG